MRHRQDARRTNATTLRESMILERPEHRLPAPAEVAAGIEKNNLPNTVTAFLFAATGPLAIYVAAATLGKMSQADIGAWIFACYGVSGAMSVLFCYVYRMPLCLGWTIAGSVLVGSALTHLPFDEVVGAFFLTAALLTVLGVTGWIGRIMDAIPLPIVMGMVAGVFLPMAISIVTAFEEAATIAAATMLAFVVVSRLPALARLFPPVLAALLAGGAATALTGAFALDTPVTFALAEPILYMPKFTLRASFELVIPVAITVIGAQNAQGFAILRDAGFRPPSNMMTFACGIGSFIMAPLGSVSTCVTGPVNGILNSSGEKDRRYVGGILVGILFMLFALFSPVAASLALALPAAFIGMLGGLALLPVLQGSFTTAFGGNFKLGAVIAFMVTVSGVSILNIGAPFWGLVFGYLASLVLEWPSFKAMKHKE